MAVRGVSRVVGDSGGGESDGGDGDACIVGGRVASEEEG